LEQFSKTLQSLKDHFELRLLPLELAPVGRLFLWLSVSLVGVGIFFFNALILLTATFLFMYLLFEGVSFHRAVNLAKDSIILEHYTPAIETSIGQAFIVETTITNSSYSKLRIARFSHNLPSQIEEIRAPTVRAESHEKQRIETLLTTSTPGRAEIIKSTILLEERKHLFCQRTEFPDKVVITARPLVDLTVDPIETSVLSDLAVDHLRRGTGTDLAGIRPFYMLDDFHSIDWKATARTGKLMTRESYPERDPTILLMIDVSSLANMRTHGSSLFEGFLSEAGNLLAAVRPVSPLGLILFDDRRVIVNIEPMQGVNSRERILCTLLERAKTVSAPSLLERPGVRPYADLAREANALTRKSAFAAKTKAYCERFSSFASFILPFYERAECKYFERLRRQGVFKAFETICTRPEPVLLIVISDGKTNLDGLAEGAKNARILNYQVVVAVLAEPEQTKRIAILSDLEGQGVGILRCCPEELSRAINAQILELSRSRTTPVEMTR
jgi:uncharacterized protein (DUF58 family)